MSFLKNAALHVFMYGSMCLVAILPLDVVFSFVTFQTFVYPTDEVLSQRVGIFISGIIVNYSSKWLKKIGEFIMDLLPFPLLSEPKRTTGGRLWGWFNILLMLGGVFFLITQQGMYGFFLNWIIGAAGSATESGMKWIRFNQVKVFYAD